MAAVIEINTGTLRSDISSMEADLDALKKEAGNLRSGAQQLGNMWDGPAKTVFMNEFLGDVTRLEELIDVMLRFTRKTDESRIEYEKCENTVGQIISSIRV